MNPLQGCTVAVIGAGTMGAGIAQVAAQAGHRVLLHDARQGAASEAKAKLGKTFDGLVAKGKLDIAAATARTDDERTAVRGAARMITAKLWPELGDLLDGDDEA